MTVTPDIYYEAVRSRDARFDGRFFTGVVTTGVYCRPVCPARTPKREHVRFFRCAAAAEEAGFRPCRRCRPETAPGTPAWQGTSATAARALRLILGGALDEAGVEQLAARVGIGARHLRRLFLAHLGAPPQAIAQTRRVHFARRLIDETTLPMARVALAADFPSIRRFNAAVRQAFGNTPTELRRQSRHLRPPSTDAPIALRLPFRPPYDWPAILRFLEKRATPGVEAVGRESYRRTVALDGSRGTVEVIRAGHSNHLLLRLQLSDPAPLARIVERVKRMFDLAADPLEIGTALGRDPLLRSIVRAHQGTRVPGAWDGFELAVRAILGQQVSVTAATTLAGRLARAFGEPVADGGAADGPSLLFPAPAALSDADLTGFGLPRARAAAIASVARSVRDGSLRLDGSGDPDETVQSLTRIAGIGSWTAQYIAMRALGDPDAFPATDLGLRRSVARSGRPMSSGELTSRAEAWRPWRAYAAMLLWIREGEAQ